MKITKLMFTLATMMALAGLQTTVLAQKCGNGDPQGTTPPPPTCDGSNPINVMSSDVAREIRDLEVWGGIGQHQLVWERYGHSRMTGGKLWFGNGHCWRHSYQWEMSVSGNTLTLNYPDGTVYTYTLTNSAWVGAPSNPDLLTQNGTNYVLQTANGWHYSFNQYPSPLRIQLDKITDAQGNIYKLTYDVHYRFSRVTEPGGRWLQVTYQDIPVDSENFTTLATCTNTPPEGQWTTLPVSNTNTYQMVRFVGSISSYGNMAELQFLDTNNNVLYGTPFGTTPPYTTNNSSYLSLFDGNTNTFFNFAYQNYSFAGLDLGSKHRIGAVRLFPRPGYASRANGASFQGANVLPTTQTAITSVQTSDGRSVTYNYGALQDSVLASDFLALTNVAYGDGTQANYGYVQIFAGQRLLLSSASDSRVKGIATQMRYAYYTNQASGLFGSIYQELSYATGQMVAQLAADALHASNSVVSYANGAVRTITDNGLGYVFKNTDALGRSTSHTFDAGGQGYVASTTDPLGYTTSYTRDSQGRLLTRVAPDGGVTTYTYDSVGQPLTVTDPLGHTTTYTRDSQHRPTLIQYPDGSTEAYTYNGFSQPLTHTLHNGGVESFGYTTNGLKTAYTNALGNVTTYTYYSNSLPATVTDANGHTTTYTYTERGLPLQVMNSDYSVKSYGYDAFGNQTAVTNELGAVWQTVYDEYQRPTAKIDPLGRTTVYDYSLPGSGGCSCANSQNKPTTIIQPGGEVTKISYGLEWQLLNQTVGYGTADAAMTQYQYDTDGHLIAMIDPNGQTWTSSYDLNGRKLSSTDPLGNKMQYTYDANGNQLTQTSPDGGVTTFTYDNQNRVLTKTDPLGGVTSHVYDAMGNEVQTQDALGRVTYNQYNLAGRLVRTTNPDGTSTGTGYDAVGNTICRTNELGAVRIIAYDTLNRQIATTDPLNRTQLTIYAPGNALSGPLATVSASGLVTTNIYDAAGQRIATISGYGSVDATMTQFVYDLDGRLQATVDALGHSWTNSYNARGNLIASTDPLGNVTQIRYALTDNKIAVIMPDGTSTRYGYDAANRLTEETNALNGVTRYGYDTMGRMIRLIDTKGNTTQWAYDLNGHLTRKTYADNTGDSYGYDAAGNQTSLLNAAGQTKTMTYSSRNQLISTYWSVSGTPAVSFTYDAAGEIVSVVNTESAVSYTYDAAGQMLTETQTHAGQSPRTLQYAYDADGQRLGLQYPSGYTLAYLYNGRGQLGSINSPDSPPPVVSYTYDAAGRRNTRTLQNGNTAQYAYDNANRLLTIAWKNLGGTAYASQSYVNDADGRRTSMTRESGAAELYGYDATSQLTNAFYTANSLNVGYSYDLMGNLINRNGFMGLNSSFSANNLNQYTGIDGNALTYDVKGNLLTCSHPLYTCSLGYDAQNRLVAAVVSSTNAAAFGYDGLNRCVRRNINGVTTYDYYDGWNLIEERDAGGNLEASYIQGADMDEQVARTTWSGSTATRLYYEGDALNSVQRLTDSGGNIVEQYRYDAFGLPSVYDASLNPLVVSAVGNRFMFQGREYFAEINLTDHRNRYYSPILQRWMSRDPIEENGGINLYVYVGDNSINKIDPTGRDCVDISNDNTQLFGDKDIGGGKISLKYGFTAKVTYSQCSKCCANGKKVEDEKYSASIDASLSIEGGPGQWGDHETFGKYRMNFSAWLGFQLYAKGSTSADGTWQTDKCNEQYSLVGNPLCLTVNLTGGINIGANATASVQKKMLGEWLTIFSGSIGLYGTGEANISATRCYLPKKGWGKLKVCSEFNTSLTANLLLMNVKLPGPSFSQCAEF